MILKSFKNKKFFAIRNFDLPSIKAKFLVPISLTLILLFFLFEIVFIQYHNRKTKINFNDDIKIIILFQNKLLNAPIWNYSEEQINEVATLSFRNKEVVYIKIYDDEKGTDLLTGFFRNNKGEIKPWNVDSVIDNRYLHTQKIGINRMVEGKNTIIGLLEMGFTSRFDQEEKKTAAKFIMFSGFVILLFIIGLLIVITNIITLPILKLTRIVDGFSENVNDRIILSKIIAMDNKLRKAAILSNDEIGKLAFAFKIMMKQLRVSLKNQTREAADRKYAEKLLNQAYDYQETVIQERTKKLTQSNEELKNAQSQLIQAAKLASLGELAAGVAHELNQPLMIMRMAGQLSARSMKQNQLSAENMVELHDVVNRNTKRMMNIIDHLRTFSRQSSGKHEFIDINKIIEASFLMVNEQLRLRNIAPDKNLMENLPKIMGDANQIEQVLLNLITNARDAIEEKIAWPNNKTYAGQINIITRLSSLKKNYMEILIKDNGGGVSTLQKDKIFDPFFTTKEVGKGTGLGLSISYGIIKEHKGEIEMTETGLKGSCFKITLPISIN